MRLMDPAATLMAYSMSKTITAAAALTLVDAGKLGLDDPVSRTVEHPYGAEVTVRQLLAHTAGIPNPLPLRWVHPAARDADFDEAAALRAVLHKHPNRSSAPGARSRYSNIGYWLLGGVIESASGRPFVEYVRERIFAPLSLTADQLAYTIADPSRHADGYLARWSFFNLAKGFLIDRALAGPRYGGWVEIEPHYVNGPAFGGLVGTARAFGAFLSDQLRPRSALFSDATRALFYEPQRTADGRPIAMTLGWHVGRVRGVPFFYKEGGGGGFHAMMRLYRERGLGTVILANTTGFDVADYLNGRDAALVV